MVRKSGEVRLSDIAKECGVSVVTAAKVLNHSGGSNTRVGAATAARISAVAQRLNYRPNLSARNLRSGGSQLIGVLIDSESLGGMARLLAAIERCADEHGYRIMIAEEHDKISNVIAGYQSFRQYGAVGVICISHDYLQGAEELYQFLADQPKLVFIGKPRLENAIYVDLEYEEKSRVALEYLWQTGRRRIALLMDPAQYLALDGRRRGFIRTLEQLGGVMGCHGRVFPVHAATLDPLEIKHAVSRCVHAGLLEWKCDAIIAMTDEYAGYVMRELLARGIRIPDEIAVIGHGNDRFAEIVDPALASIDDDLAAQGRGAVELLLRMIDAADEIPPQERCTMIHPRLIWRPSAGGDGENINFEKETTGSRKD